MMHSSNKNEELGKMVRCLDCFNLMKAFFPAASSGSLFDEKWKCSATGEVFDMYYLVEIKRLCTKFRSQHSTSLLHTR